MLDAATTKLHWPRLRQSTIACKSNQVTLAVLSVNYQRPQPTCIIVGCASSKKHYQLRLQQIIVYPGFCKVPLVVASTHYKQVRLLHNYSCCSSNIFLSNIARIKYWLPPYYMKISNSHGSGAKLLTVRIYEQKSAESTLSCHLETTKGPGSYPITHIQ